MIVSAGVATTAKAKALTEEKVERKRAEWDALSEDHSLKRLMGAFEDISQDVFWAGWLQDIHVAVWGLLGEAKHDAPAGCTMAELEARIALIRSVTVEDPEAPWWPVFDLADTVLGYAVGWKMPLEQWEACQPVAARPPFILSF